MATRVPFPDWPGVRITESWRIISDLADFAVVLRPNLGDMDAPRLCRLIEKYAAYERRPSDLTFPSSLDRREH